MSDPRDVAPYATVYHFKMYDIKDDDYIASKRKATADTIQEFNGIVLQETEQHVGIKELDGNGFYPKK